MFQFSSTTKVDKEFKLNELFKLIKASKELKSHSQNILSVKMTNALSEQTTKLKPTNEVNEIYVIKVGLNSPNVPYEFLKQFDKAVHFQVLYKLVYENKVKYLTGYKTITDNKVSQTRVFETDWISPALKELPLLKNLAELYKQILAEIATIKFREDEDIKSYITRLVEIEKLQKDFKKIEKLAQSEVQPKKKLEYNEQLREIYKQIKEKE